jgi:predicted GIY-YIG superfamily endonuclease
MNQPMAFYVYIVRCSDGSLYTGHTENLEMRIAAHNSGALRGYTFPRRPVHLIFHQDFQSRDEAFRLERQIKGWSRRKKLALSRGDWNALRELSSSSNARRSVRL